MEISFSVLLIVLMLSTTILMVMNIINDIKTNKIEKEIKEYYFEQIRSIRNSEDDNK